MKKNIIIAIALLAVTLSGGCGNNNNAQESDSAVDVTVEEDTEQSSETVTETLPEEPMEEEPESDETDKQNQDTAGWQMGFIQQSLRQTAVCFVSMKPARARER